MNSFLNRVACAAAVVISALAGITDELLDLAQRYGAGDRLTIERSVDALLQQHERVGEALAGCGSPLESIRADAEQLCKGPAAGTIVCCR